MILAACSKHFQELFDSAPPSHAGACYVILEATTADNMQALLEFMYKGEVHVSQDALSSFLKSGENLQVYFIVLTHGERFCHRQFVYDKIFYSTVSYPAYICPKLIQHTTIVFIVKYNNVSVVSRMLQYNQEMVQCYWYLLNY